MSEWISVDDKLPEAIVWVLVWLHLPRNPPASGINIAQFAGCREDEPLSYGDWRRTVGCWWANGRYYEKGHVTHWMPLPEPPERANELESKRLRMWRNIRNMMREFARTANGPLVTIGVRVIIARKAAKQHGDTFIRQRCRSQPSRRQSCPLFRRLS